MYAVVHYEEPVGTHILSGTDTVHEFDTAEEALCFMESDIAFRDWADHNWREHFRGDILYGGISRSWKRSGKWKGAVEAVGLAVLIYAAMLLGAM